MSINIKNLLYILIEIIIEFYRYKIEIKQKSERRESRSY